jgi:hypothetical protein
MTHRSALSHPRRALLAWWAATAGALAAALLMTCAAAHAAVAPQAFDGAFQQFQRAANDGDEKSIEGAAEQFGRLAAADPADPVLIAYSGAATAMRATTTLLPWKKMGYADDGLGQLDRALTMLNAGHDGLLHNGVPATLEAKFVAASTFLRLPTMFNRHARGARLLDEVLKSPLLASAPLGFRAAVWMRAAAEARSDKRPDQARQWLQQVVASGAPQSAAAQAQLKDIQP